MMDLAGQQFGRYRVESLLGSGGIADVYRASDLTQGRAVALKLIRAELSADPAFVARFLQTAPRLAALDHPHIVPIADWGQVDGDCYLALDLMPAGSLRHLLDLHAAPPGRSMRAGLDFARQAAEGLAHAHAHGVIHGDIRPENLLLVDASEGGTLLRVADFGLAGLVESSVLVGAPAYLSPEQLQGQPAAAQSDIYALGVVLYEALTGLQPFAATSFSDAVYLHGQMPPLPPREIRPDLPPAIEAIVLRCLAKSPADRYTAAADLAAELRAALLELGDPAPPTALPATAIPPETITAPEPGRVSLAPRDSASLSLIPGAPAVIGLILANSGPAVVRVTLTVAGAPSAWIAVPDHEIAIAPGGEVPVELTVTVARDPQAPAGEYPVTIRAGTGPGTTRATLAALWTVLPFANGELRLEPARASGKSGASYTLHLQNLGNAPLRRALVATASEGLTCTLAMDMADLDPGMQATIGLRVAAPRRWFGLARSRPFAVEATSASAASLRAEGEFVHQALVPSWVPPVATVLLGLLVILIAILFRPGDWRLPLAAAPTPTAVVAIEPSSAPTEVVLAPSPSASAAPSAAPRATTTPTAGAGSGVPSVALSATLLNFGSLPVGGSAVQTLQVRNSGARPVTFGVQIAGAAATDFVRSGPCGTQALTPGLTCPVTIIFTPTGTGSRAARLTITPAGGEAQAVILTGTGTAAGTAQITLPSRPPPAMAGVRGGHAAALFADGRKLLVAGGRNGLNQLKSVEVYDLATNAWGGTRDMGVPRAGHTATTLPDGTVLVLGGRSGPNTLKSAEVYDPNTQTWSPFPALATAREGHTATLLADPRTRGYRLLVLGGRDQNGAVLSSGEIYDSATRAWTETPGLIPGGRARHTATLLKQEIPGLPRILVVGGVDQTETPAPAELFDPAGPGTWTAVPGVPDDLAASSDFTATLLEATGKVLFVGGTSAGIDSTTVTAYDPAAAPDQAWSESRGLLSAGRSAHTATLLPYGRILLTGGKEGNRETASTELFDPARVATVLEIGAAIIPSPHSMALRVWPAMTVARVRRGLVEG